MAQEEDDAARLAWRMTGPGGLRLGILAIFIALQAVCAGFFLGDVTLDFFTIGLDRHTGFEMAATLALILGVSLGGYEMVRSIRLMRQAQDALNMASGAFADLLRDRFKLWQLTPAEAEVALLTLKGFDGPEIADLRGTAPGTVRAQLGRIYAKSGTHARGQFVSLFIDALLDDPVLAAPAQGG